MDMITRARAQNDALELRKWGNDLQVQVVEMESDMLHCQREAQEMGGLNRDLRARIADDESTIRDWMSHSDKLNASVNELSLENIRLRKKNGSMKEEEELAVEEMDEILEMINSSANTDFEFLVEAVEFLLEIG